MLTTRIARFYKVISRKSALPLADNIVYSPQVEKALLAKKPVVALQSTIISHGMPYPANFQCANQVQNIIRQHKVTPATIAIMDGKIRVGLTPQQLQRLAQEGSRGLVKKTSRRDISYCLATSTTGATTVSGTMLCSELAGIDVFVTGGLGGVHRGAQLTMDVSADLREMGRTPVTVICAGVKSILDIPKTLQYLETEGVPVVTLNSAQFPAFYSRSSGCKSPLTLNNESDIAKMIHQSRKLSLKNGILVGVPNPYTEAGEEIEKAIELALEEVRQKDIKGHEVTPYMLKRVNEITGGKGLESNIALVFNNAKVGAQIALELYKLEKGKKAAQKSVKDKSQTVSDVTKPSTEASQENEFSIKKEPKTVKIRKSKYVLSQPVIIGGSAIDNYLAPILPKGFELGKSNPGKLKSSFGGVARNIAEVAGRLGAKPKFITPLGRDESGFAIAKYMASAGVELHKIDVSSESTGRYTHLMLPNGDMMIGVADMDINNYLTFDNIFNALFKDINLAPGTVVELDSNIPVDALMKLVPFLKDEQKAFIMYEGISRKCIRILESQALTKVNFVKINEVEVGFYRDYFENTLKENLTAQEMAAKVSNMLGGAVPESNGQTRAFLITKGEKGSELWQRGSPKKFPCLPCRVVKTNGAGDTMTGSIIYALSSGHSLEEAISFGICATKISIESPIGQSTIPETLSLKAVKGIQEEFMKIGTLANSY